MMSDFGIKNNQIRLLMGQALDEKFAGTWSTMDLQDLTKFADRFAELLKQAIYDQVKQELIDDADIDATTDPLAREYLKGCNGGTVDALCHIQNFGVDIDE